MKKYEVKFSERVFEVEAKDEEQAEFLGLQARDNDEMAGGAEISVNEIHEFTPANRQKCQVCKKDATINLQGGGWRLYDINPERQSYTERKAWGDGDEENSFYCDKHAESEGVA